MTSALTSALLTGSNKVSLVAPDVNDAVLRINDGYLTASELAALDVKMAMTPQAVVAALGLDLAGSWGQTAAEQDARVSPASYRRGDSGSGSRQVLQVGSQKGANFSLPWRDVESGWVSWEATGQLSTPG